MDLADHYEVRWVREPFQNPDLPQGFLTVEVLRRDARRQALELSLISRPRQRDVTDVIINVEMLIVHPHGMIRHRDISQPLAVARNEVQPRGDVVANLIDVDAAIGCPERPALERCPAGNVHGAGGGLHHEKRVVEEAETVVGMRRYGDVLYSVNWRMSLAPPPVHGMQRSRREMRR